jgi:hypothetical protein
LNVVLPFAREEFVALFAKYNDAVWPVQVLAYLLGLAMVAMVLRPSRAGDRAVAAGLAAMWLWTGVAYQWLQFSTINPAAYGFAMLFVLQGVLFSVAAARGTLSFGTPARQMAWAGLAFVVYAMLLYPLVGLLSGHRYPALPMFGIAPCPVVIFTFGMLMMASAPVSRWLLVVPLVWSLVGGSAAALLGVPQDWFLLFSGLAVPMMVVSERRCGHRPAPLAPRNP